jgi:hypothetical protein
VSAVRGGAGEVQYLVLPDPSNPWLLARVRWPDVFQAISAAEPDWRTDPGLFDLPYDPSSHAVTAEEAEAIASEWGARLPVPGEPEPSGRLLLRRMPANWSDPSRAEKRAWSIETVRTRDASASRKRVWARRRRLDEDAGVAAEPAEAPADETTLVVDEEPEVVIDLTDAREAELTAVDGA